MRLVRSLCRAIAADKVSTSGARMVRAASNREVNRLAHIMATKQDELADEFRNVPLPEVNPALFIRGLEGVPVPTRDRIRCIVNERVLSQIPPEDEGACVTTPRVSRDELAAWRDRLVRKARGETTAIGREDIEACATALKGINRGNDEIARTRLVFSSASSGGQASGFWISAFDRVGFEVLRVGVSFNKFFGLPNEECGPNLFIDSIKAAHGRDVCGRRSMDPRLGRGNPPLVAELFRGLATLGAEHGFRSLRLSPASAGVAAHYRRMGFRDTQFKFWVPAFVLQGGVMDLRLDDRESMNQLLLEFYPRQSEAGVRRIPPRQSYVHKLEERLGLRASSSVAPHRLQPGKEVAQLRASAGDWLDLPDVGPPST